MNWEAFLGLKDGQGVFFWTAVATASAGLALLFAAGVAQVRRLIAAGGARRAGRSRDERPAAQIVRPTADGYEPAVRAPRTRPDVALAQVQARLGAAADRLAELRGASVPLESSLKEGVKDVEYVFRTGLG